MIQAERELEQLLEDGLNGLFIQRYWTVLGPQTIKICLNILNENGMVEGINNTSIILIPKENKA